MIKNKFKKLKKTLILKSLHFLFDILLVFIVVIFIVKII